VASGEAIAKLLPQQGARRGLVNSRKIDGCPEVLARIVATAAQGLCKLAILVEMRKLPRPIETIRKPFGKTWIFWLTTRGDHPYLGNVLDNRPEPHSRRPWM